VKQDKVFEVKVSGRRGQKTILVLADSEDSARNQALHQGDVVLSCRAKRKSLFQGALSEADRHTLLTRLGAMLSSRLGQGDSLRLIRDNFPRRGKISRTAESLLQYIETGKDLPGAMELVGAPDFPRTVTALVKAGSRAGDTGRALQEATSYEQEVRRIRKNASKGLLSAVFGFIAAALTILGSSFYMGPQVLHSGLIQAGGKNLHVHWIFTLGDWIGYMMLAMLVLAIPLALLATVVRQIIPNAADMLILKIPFYNELVLSRGNYITLYGLAMLVRSGVRIEDALRLAQDTAPKGALRKDLELAEAAMRRNGRWVEAMRTLHPTDKAALAAALNREQVASTLLALAEQYKEIYAQRLATFVPTLTLVSALLLTIAGGILFGETILPMLQASSGITGG